MRAHHSISIKPPMDRASRLPSTYGHELSVGLLSPDACGAVSALFLSRSGDGGAQASLLLGALRLTRRCVLLGADGELELLLALPRAFFGERGRADAVLLGSLGGGRRVVWQAHAVLSHALLLLGGAQGDVAAARLVGLA